MRYIISSNSPIAEVKDVEVTGTTPQTALRLYLSLVRPYDHASFMLESWELNQDGSMRITTKQGGKRQTWVLTPLTPIELQNAGVK